VNGIALFKADMEKKNANNREEPRRREPEWLAIVQRHVASLGYGVVQIIVHDGRVIQIERTEKLRLNANSDWEI
jgi:hypothetical protein